MKLKYKYRLRKIAEIANASGGKVLDLGFSLLPNPFLQGEVIGADILLPKEKPKNYLKMLKADVCKKLPFKNSSMNTIILGGVIEHIENPLAALREINRVLKPNGVVLIETPNPYYLPVILSDLTMNLKYFFYDTHINLFPRRIMLKMLWHTGFDLKKIIGCGMNLSDSVTIPLPQQLSQDVIYVAVKKTPNSKLFNEVRKLRDYNYEKKIFMERK